MYQSHLSVFLCSSDGDRRVNTNQMRLFFSAMNERESEGRSINLSPFEKNMQELLPDWDKADNSEKLIIFLNRAQYFFSSSSGIYHSIISCLHMYMGIVVFWEVWKSTSNGSLQKFGFKCDKSKFWPIINTDKCVMRCTNVTM